MKIFNSSLIYLCVLMASVSVNAQTTINLAEQCNCEVLKSTTELTAGATTPTGADTGDLLVDPSGDIFYWDGNSWEPASSLGTAIEPWFGTDNDAAATSNTENIYQLGNVGIGTTNPTSNLHVMDPLTGNIMVAEFETPAQDNVEHYTSIGVSKGGWGGEFRGYHYPGVSNGISFTVGQVGSGNQKEVMRVTQDGFLAVGGNAPTERLWVNGNIKATGNLQSASTTYPDYVFEAYEAGESSLNKDYSFKNLEEVEAFIKINKHLPGVAGIKELERAEDGKYNVNITTTSIQTLEKVEELFLYTIEQNKKIKGLEKEVEELKAEMAQIKAMILKNQK